MAASYSRAVTLSSHSRQSLHGSSLAAQSHLFSFPLSNFCFPVKVCFPPLFPFLLYKHTYTIEHIYFYFIYGAVYRRVYAGSLRGQKRASFLLELDLQATSPPHPPCGFRDLNVSPHCWVSSDLNCWSISAALIILNLESVYWNKIWYLSFYSWLTSLNIMISSPFHLPANVRVWFFLMDAWNSSQMSPSSSACSTVHIGRWRLSYEQAQWQDELDYLQSHDHSDDTVLWELQHLCPLTCRKQLCITPIDLTRKIKMGDPYNHLLAISLTQDGDRRKEHENCLWNWETMILKLRSINKNSKTPLGFFRDHISSHLILPQPKSSLISF